MTNTQSQDNPLKLWLSSLSAINAAKEIGDLMQVPCRGGGQGYSAHVRESPAGREPAVCALSFPPHATQGMCWEKDQEGQ